MTNLNLEVKVKNIGSAVGTSGWLKSYLSGRTLELGMTRDKMPCVYLVGKDNEGHREVDLLAFVEPSDYRDRYVLHGNNIYSIHVQSDFEPYSHNTKAFVGYATPAAYEVIDSLIDKAVDILSDYLENEKADFKLIFEKI